MEDDELQRAIALSLETSKSSRHEVVDVEDSEDDETFQSQLKQAIEASKSLISATSSHAPAAITSQDQSVATGSSAFLAERASLEEARLERQKKRLRPIRDPEPVVNAEVDKTSAKKRRLSPHSVTDVQIITGRASEENASAELGEKFWEGELRQTANIHTHPRRDGQPTFRLTTVIGEKSDLAFAIISSYCLDIAWVYQFFDPRVPVILVAQPAPESSGEPDMHYALPNWIRTTPRLRRGVGCMHMKFMLLFYASGRLRIVVSTANLIPHDFRDIENTIWLQDIPLRAPPVASTPRNSDDFPSVLQRVLYAIHVQPALTTMLTDHPNLPIQAITDLRSRWDWSKVKARLIPSLSGQTRGWEEISRVGHTRLGKLVSDIKLPKAGKQLVLECQGSSIGYYTSEWLNQFYRSALGESLTSYLNMPQKERKKQEWPPLKIVFPSLKTVQASVLGPAGGGTMFCRRSQWELGNFPKHLFYDSNSRAGGVLMHSKMIIATLQDVEKGKQSKLRFSREHEDATTDEVVEMPPPTIGWAYIGSHNFTPAAWGTLSGSNTDPVLNCRNYELGVMIPLRDEAEADKVACFERPPRKYNSSADVPWIQDEHLIEHGVD